MHVNTKRIVLFLILGLIISGFIFKDSVLSDHHIYVNGNGNEVQKTISYVSRVESLQKKHHNQDIVGFLTIPGTDIDEPVRQGEDNEFYLSHDINKEKNLIGSVFLDYRVKINERKNLIYSHNSSTLGVPFKELENYYQEDYFKAHQKIILEDTKGKQEYQIFSIFVETSDWQFMKVKFTESQWLEHLKYLENKSWFKTQNEWSNQDEILILQTCSHHQDYQNYERKYLVIAAKKI